MLEAKNITFSYTNKRSDAIFENFDFTVHGGERIALIAPSGTGKTTLCRLLAGYLKPQAGEILLDGESLNNALNKKKPQNTLHGNNKLKPNKRSLFPESTSAKRSHSPNPVQLISQHPEQTLNPRIRISKSLEEAGLARSSPINATTAKNNQDNSTPNTNSQINESPAETTHSKKAYNSSEILCALSINPSWMTRYPAELSGGQLQRICIARALLTHPKFIICDEVTSMLDAITQAQIWRTLLQYANDARAGLVFTSHNPALIKKIATRTFEL